MSDVGLPGGWFLAPVTGSWKKEGKWTNKWGPMTYLTISVWFNEQNEMKWVIKNDSDEGNESNGNEKYELWMLINNLPEW